MTEKECKKICPICGERCTVCSGPSSPEGFPLVTIPFEEHKVHLCSNMHIWES